jgi:8-oxo-dGTP pyrophosphatase MutT (NUDIX family)
MKQSTLCLLIKENGREKELLLAMKKRGFGVNRWNGVGGKFNPEQGDKTIEDAAIRETEEELGVKPKEMEKVAVFNFYYPYLFEEDKKNWQVHIFFVKDWQGEPVETEEMAPRWFKESEIPFNEMWPDDSIWLPKVLAGKKLMGDFFFKEGDLIAKHDIKTVKEL